MAIKTNTTQTIDRSSTVLGEKCVATQKNLKQLCAKAGCPADEKIMTVGIPIDPTSKDDVLFAGLNGADFYFMRGETVKMPECVYQLLRNCKKI